MKKLSAVCRNFEEVVAGTGLVITIMAVAFNVIMRYFFSRSQNWAEEIASMGFSWVVFVGAAAVYKRKMHIGIDVFVNLMPKFVQTALQWGMTVFFVVLNAYLAYLSTVFAISAWTKPTHILLIPYTFVDLSATVGFALMTVHAVNDLAVLLKSPGKTAREGV